MQYEHTELNNSSNIEREWSLCLNSINNEEKLLKILYSLALLAGSLVSFCFFRYKEDTLAFLDSGNYICNFYVPNYYGLILFDCLVVTLFSIYFAEFLKSIALSKRKLIVLRSKLNINWDKYNLILPHWRLEGAQNPFVIKIVPRWLSQEGLLIFSVLLFNESFMLELLSFSTISPQMYLISLMFILFFPLVCYRKTLCDKYENISLILLKFLAHILNFKIHNNFEYRIYEAKLNALRVKNTVINFDDGKKLAKEIEDKSFDTNKGIDYRGILRALLVRIPFIGSRLASRKNWNKHSGASTITMQFVRTLFFSNFNKTRTRKILEILFSFFWASRIFTKDEILDIYLSSINFASKTTNLLDAIKFYHLPIHLKKEHWFFLIERLAYIHQQQVNLFRIKHLAKKCRLEDMLQTSIIPLYFNIFDLISPKNKFQLQILDMKFTQPIKALFSFSGEKGIVFLQRSA